MLLYKRVISYPMYQPENVKAFSSLTLVSWSGPMYFPLPFISNSGSNSSLKALDETPVVDGSKSDMYSTPTDPGLNIHMRYDMEFKLYVTNRLDILYLLQPDDSNSYKVGSKLSLQVVFFYLNEEKKICNHYEKSFYLIIFFR